MKPIVVEEPGEQEIIQPFTQEGEGREVTVIVKGTRRGEYFLRLLALHEVGHTKGRITVRGIASRGAKVKVEGMIRIAKQAIGADDFLDIRLLILDDISQAMAEPKLEIEADEVQASHAVSVGYIDEEQIIYLMSRGLSRQQAEEMIVEGFLKSV